MSRCILLVALLLTCISIGCQSKTPCLSKWTAGQRLQQRLDPKQKAILLTNKAEIGTYGQVMIYVARGRPGIARNLAEVLLMKCRGDVWINQDYALDNEEAWEVEPEPTQLDCGGKQWPHRR